ncbi:HU family DNA-binding protein [candidate division KSB1 bacterium]|nr:HU family DNA-binding protein [candidate division KSB1 bacterium]
MNKADIIDQVAKGTGLTKSETRLLMDNFLVVIARGLYIDGRIDIRGFGSFKVVTRRARTARNPKTGEPVHIPEHEKVIFRPFKDLRNYINMKKN